MENQNIIQRITQNLNADLNGVLMETVETHEIPMWPHELRDEDMCITIFAKNANPKFTKKNKCKTAVPRLDITHVLGSEFSLEALEDQRIKPTTLFFLYPELKPECLEPVTAKIKYWSRTLFTAAQKWYRKSNDIELVMLPFEICLDYDDNTYLSRLPNFCDLRFIDKQNKLFDNNAFIASQAAAIEEQFAGLASIQEG